MVTGVVAILTIDKITMVTTTDMALAGAIITIIITMVTTEATTTRVVISTTEMATRGSDKVIRSGNYSSYFSI